MLGPTGTVRLRGVARVMRSTGVTMKQAAKLMAKIPPVPGSVRDVLR